MRNNLWLILLTLAVGALRADPFEKGGAYTLGARAAAMGGAQVASSEDASCLDYNPACLFHADGSCEVYGQYGALLGNKIIESYFGHRGIIPDLELGYGIGYWNLSSTERYHYTEQMLIAALAVPFSNDKRLLFGTSLKYLQSGMDLPGTSSSGYGLDVGFRYRVPGLGEKLDLGLSVLDFQSSLSYEDGQEFSPPQLILAGCSYKFDRDTVLELDGEQINNLRSPGRSSQGFRTGVEHWFFGKVVALRVGYSQSSALSGRFSYGLGASYREFQLDAAYIQDINQLGDSLRVSGIYRFGWPFSGKTPPARETATGRESGAAAKGRLLKAGISARPASFSPMEGAENPLTRIEAALEGDSSQVASWRLAVVAPSGNTVSVFEGDGPGMPPVEWKGKNEKGELQADGAYQILLQMLDGDKRELASARASVRLSRETVQLELTPEFSRFAPGGMSRRPTLKFTAVVSGGGNIKAFTFTVKDGKRNTQKTVTGRNKLPAYFEWDGKKRSGKMAPDGVYNAALEIIFKNGAKKDAQARVEVDSRRAKISFKAEPLLFTPGKESISILPGVEQDADLIAGWEISIENLSGTKLRAFKGTGAPKEKILWNGMDDRGSSVPPGTLFYIDYAAVMSSGALATTPRVAVSSEIRRFEEESAIKVPLATLYFAPGDEVIELEQYISLKNAADAVKKYGANYLVQVKGYCDEGETQKSPIGPMELSALRAKGVMDYLIKAQGVPEARVASAGYGAAGNEPGGGSSEESRKRNRRVEVILFTK